MDINALTPKQQASEAVRQAENILISTGQFPSVDQVAATLALARILRKLGKKVTAIISDQLPTQASFLPAEVLDTALGGQRDFVLKVSLKRTEVDSLKYTVENGFLNVHITPKQGGYAPSDVTFGYGAYRYDVAIVLGVPTRTRLDKLFSQNPEIIANIPMINLDFHRSNELYGAINLIDTNAASLCEMLVALSESLQSGLIDEDIATALLTGIIASTDRFTAAHTTPKALTVAAQMMAIGAKQQTVIKGLYKSNENRSSDSNRDRDGRGGSGGGNVRPRDNRPNSGGRDNAAPQRCEQILPVTPVAVGPEIEPVAEAAVESQSVPTAQPSAHEIMAAEAQKAVVQALQPDPNEPHLFFKGQGSVLANLPDDSNDMPSRGMNDPFGTLAAA